MADAHSPQSKTPEAIARERTLPPAQDYAFLRDTALGRIQALSSAVWTDHNSHDPGITLLEALAYAVTDLGYRTGFPIADLLTRPDGQIGPASDTGLYPAHEALTCAPLSISDHRQLMMRIRDVHNAWLDPMQDPQEMANYRLSEVPLYADCANDRLTDQAVVNGVETHPVRLNGLYKVLVELEGDTVLGSLNETALEYTIKGGPLKGVRVVIDCDDPDFVAGQLDFSDAFPGFRAAPPPATVSGLNPDFTAVVNLDLPAGDSLLTAFSDLSITVLEDRPRPNAPAVSVDSNDLEGVLAATDADAIIRRFWDKQQRRQQALDRVRCVINEYRPLCEDWLSVAAIAPYRVGICADVDLAPEADMEAIQAAIYYAIEQYFSPPVAWKSLDTLLLADTPADQVFNGPYVDYSLQCAGADVFTKPGFLTADDLQTTELRRAVHSSDIINLVQDLEGVAGIRRLTLRAYDNAGNPLGDTEEWTLTVPPDHQPVLFFAGSKLMFFKGQLPFRAGQVEFLRTLEHLRALSRAALYVPPDQVLPEPLGRWRNLDTVYPVQHDLPQLYGVGTVGLPSEADEARIAQARQLKGFMAHLDWLLADYLGQLSNARQLLSPDPALGRSYFPLYVDNAAGTRGDYETEFYVDPAGLADDLYRASLTETEEVYLDRRSRALDHLLARFAERFADYALMSFDQVGDSLRTAQELIADKAAFLAEAPVLSRERSSGFNYRPEDATRVWDTDNVPGLQKRVARLLGIADCSRRDLHCASLFNAMVETVDDAGWRLRIASGEGAVLFESQETFAAEAVLLAEAEPIFERLRREETYEIDDSGGPNAVELRLLDGEGALLTHREQFTNAGEAARRAREIVLRYDALLQSAGCDQEGMHLVEHILLRPRRTDDRLMQVCLASDCELCGEEDPYSFILHVVLPYWPTRFRSLDFRRYAEQLIREEMPSHIVPRICWVGNEDMRELDRTWNSWLTMTRNPAADPADLSAALDELIAVLERLHTVHSPATLHDCEEGEGDTIVRLGATNLGLF